MKKLLLSVPKGAYGMTLAYGTQRDETNKTLYVEQEDIQHFAFLLSKGTICCERLYLLEKEADCWSCHKKTTNYMLATDLIVGPFSGARYTDFKILTYVQKVPYNLWAYLKEKGYYFAHSKQGKTSYFMNHCANCNILQGDHYLLNDPNIAIYKHLFYKNETPCVYHEIVSDYILSIRAVIPTYEDQKNPRDVFNALR